MEAEFARQPEVGHPVCAISQFALLGVSTDPVGRVWKRIELGAVGWIDWYFVAVRLSFDSPRVARLASSLPRSLSP